MSDSIVDTLDPADLAPDLAPDLARFPERLTRVARAIAASYGVDYDRQPEYCATGLPAQRPGRLSKADLRTMARAALESEGIVIDD